jgi:hypothetical protein
MFLSYKNKPFTIIDEDFEQVSTMTGWEGIVGVYEQRKLPVAPNLIRAISYWCRENYMNEAPMMPLIMKNVACIPYKDEVERYMLLL